MSQTIDGPFLNRVWLGLPAPIDVSQGSVQPPLSLYKNQIISGQAATVNLTNFQSGSICLFDSAAGIVYTLPAPVVGLVFEFVTTVTITSNSAKVITDASTTLLQGSSGVLASAVTQFAANGTTHRSINGNGTTTGGVLGSWSRFRCVAPTIWQVESLQVGSGTGATPFATS